MDEIIDLVNNWNFMHCTSSQFKFKQTSKKRAHPSSILDNMIATPAKKSKFNNFQASDNRNCLLDLETEARKKLCELVTEAIKSIYNIDLDETQQQQLLLHQLARPTHDRGEITLPCFRLSKILKTKPDKIAEDIVENLSKAIQNNTGVLFLSNPFKKVEAAKGRINVYLSARYLGLCLYLYSIAMSARIRYFTMYKHI